VTAVPDRPLIGAVQFFSWSPKWAAHTQRKIIGNIDHAKLLTANKANIVDPTKSFSN